MFNTNPRIRSLRIDDVHACHAIDDALRDPGYWIDYAAQHAAGFDRAKHNEFPGPELRLPDAVSAQLDQFFALHVRRLLDARRTLRMDSRLSMVTVPPQQLEPAQRICHRDRLGVPLDRVIAASVLYLFGDPALGGTSFYRPRRPPAEIEALVRDSAGLSTQAFEATYQWPPAYMTASNAWFEKVLTVEPRPNRLIFYDGSLFHGGDILHPERLRDDPRSGRLTLNGFFICQRALSASRPGAVA